MERQHHGLWNAHSMGRLYRTSMPLRMLGYLYCQHPLDRSLVTYISHSFNPMHSTDRLRKAQVSGEEVAEMAAYSDGCILKRHVFLPFVSMVLQLSLLSPVRWQWQNTVGRSFLLVKIEKPMTKHHATLKIFHCSTCFSSSLRCSLLSMEENVDGNYSGELRSQRFHFAQMCESMNLRGAWNPCVHMRSMNFHCSRNYNKKWNVQLSYCPPIAPPMKLNSYNLYTVQ